MKTTATLPDELVLETLARVTDVPALFRCAMACKRWSRLIADPFFLRGRWPKCAHHPPSSYLLGFFVTRTRGIMRPVLTPALVPLPRFAIDFGRSFIVSFPSGSASLLDRTYPIASRGGLLLARLVRRKEEDYKHRGTIRLAVCDPTFGTCNVLPTLICQGSFVGGQYAILTDADFCSSGQQRPRPLPGFSASFKVVVLAMHDGFFKLHTFSSGDSSWSTTDEQLYDHPEDRDPLAFGPRNATVCHGAPHWLVWDWVDYYTLGVSAETSHVFVTKICATMNYFNYKADVYDTPFLSVTAEGMLSLLCLHKDGRRLETWTRQDETENNQDGGGSWLPSPVIELNLPRQRQKYDEGPYECLVESNGVLLIEDNDARRLYVTDIKTAVEEVTDSFYGLITDGIVPFHYARFAYRSPTGSFPFTTPDLLIDRLPISGARQK